MFRYFILISVAFGSSLLMSCNFDRVELLSVKCNNRIIAVNIDDDNQDGIEDRKQMNIIATSRDIGVDEDNLSVVEIVVQPVRNAVLKLSVDSDSDKVAIWTSPIKAVGSQVNFDGRGNVFNIDSDSETIVKVYVEGINGSSFMEDIIFKVDLYKGSRLLSTSTVLLTVLEFNLILNFVGGVSSDNEAREHYRLINAEDNYALGRHEMYSHIGYGAEFKGVVTPDNFTGKIDMRRELVKEVTFIDLNGDGTFDKDNDVTIQVDLKDDSSNQDENGAEFDGPCYNKKVVDEDPQSGGSKGKVYDLDAPGIGFTRYTSNITVRQRINFRQYAVYNGQTLASKNWFHRSSAILKTGGNQLAYHTCNPITGGGELAYVNRVGDKCFPPQNPTWTVDLWKKGRLIFEPTGNEILDKRLSFNNRIIKSNTNSDQTGTTITVKCEWRSSESANLLFQIVKPNYQDWDVETSYSKDGCSPCDNMNGEGATSLTWDLK